MARTAIAYVVGSPEATLADRTELDRRRDLRVVKVVREDGGGRSRLGEALGRIAAREASTLALARLGDAAGSLSELIGLLDWLAASGADLVALDVALDTASPSGRRMSTLLREVDGWERNPKHGRAARGRPGLAAHAPELSERVAAMRERGLSLQAIADTLNADGIPTPRGGAHWRPSSVQAALGYRRPRPGLHGAPPPPPHHPPPPAPPGRARGPRPKPSRRSGPPRP
jgi:DNA invertase Pin-like site-specific DNA recombinase